MIFHAEQLNNVSRGDLGTLTVLDSKGFICGNDENAPEFSKRLQTLNDNLQQMEDVLCTSKEYHIEGIIAKQANRISPEFYDEPGKLTKELYDFQCKWVPGFFTSQEMNGFLFGGCALSFLPDFFALFLIRNSFKKRQKWLFYNRNELLAHELCHIARIALNSSTYEEIFAYRTSPSAFRRYFGGIFHSAWDSYIFLFSTILLMVAQIIRSFFWHNLPTWPFWGILGFVVIGMILRHIFNLSTLRRAKKRLENIFQIRDAWPILFRCTDDEINIFGGFSEHKVQNFIQNCRNSSSLRWKIILNKWALSPKWQKKD